MKKWKKCGMVALMVLSTFILPSCQRNVAAAVVDGSATTENDASATTTASGEDGLVLEDGSQASDDSIVEEEEVNYDRDYLTKTFDSEDGLDGSAMNCIYSSKEGFLWIGGYTGLYRYDGTEFKRFMIQNETLPVNQIVENSDGLLWIGTNGDGLFQYDGSSFTEYSLNSNESGVHTIEDLYVAQNGRLWVGTMAGLYCIDQESGDVKKFDALDGFEIKDINELSDGTILVVCKTGEIYEITGDELKTITISGWSGEDVPRCISEGNDDSFYIGTDAEHILKVNKNGEVQCIITAGSLSSFNAIYEYDDGTYWVCSDSGIGVLKNDQLTELYTPLDDSVEDCCIDYQKNYWFASSRSGIMQLYRNDYANLGAYWGIKGVVNALQVEDDKVYVGCDDGLYCYEGNIKIENDLTRSCTGERIRQIYKDSQGRLWVSTYQSGIRVQDRDGSIIVLNKSNTELSTDRIRCVWQQKNGTIIIGTEEGLFLCKSNSQVERFLEDDSLDMKRILDVREGPDGKIYVATDGYGLYVINDNKVEEIYTKADGLSSGSVLKVVPSDSMQGVWVVMGECISFIGEDGKLRNVTGLSTANNLDLILTEDGEALILASNGLFRVKEEDLLGKEKISYTQYSKQDGLPIDFTANAWNVLDGDSLYMCGTSGAASIDLAEDRTEYPISLYVESATADGKEVEFNEDGITIPASTHRLNIDIRPINFVYRNLSTGYWLRGIDDKETIEDASVLGDVSYTDVKGGNYRYEYRILDGKTGESLSEISFSVVKAYKFWEVPRVRIVTVFIGILIIFGVIIIAIRLTERGMEKRYQKKMYRMKAEEMGRMALYDTATGAFNRNYYEKEVEILEKKKKKICAFFSVSVNYVEYYRSRKGVLFVEEMMREAIKVLTSQTEEKDLKIFRMSSNVFFFWLAESVCLEDYIYKIKEAFKDVFEEPDRFSLAVGGVYNEAGKSVHELFEHCEEIRMLDEKLAEAKFIEGQINMFR